MAGGELSPKKEKLSQNLKRNKKKIGEIDSEGTPANNEVPLKCSLAQYCIDNTMKTKRIARIRFSHWTTQNLVDCLRIPLLRGSDGIIFQQPIEFQAIKLGKVIPHIGAISFSYIVHHPFYRPPRKLGPGGESPSSSQGGAT